MLLQVERSINSIYYCAPCSVAVKLCNRDEHENTVQHIKSVKHDELLKQLSDMYKESDNDKIDKTATSVPKNISDSQHSSSKTDLNATVCKNVNNNLNNLDENKYHDMEKNDDIVTESRDHMFKRVTMTENVEDKSAKRTEVNNSEGNTQMQLAPTKLQNNDGAVDESVNSNAVNRAAKTHFCDICNQNIPYHSRKCIATHKSSDEHKKAVDNHIEFLTTYQLVPVGLLKRHSKGQKHTPGRNKSKLWYCLVCCFEVTNPKPHVRETNHIMMYDKLLSTNLLIKLRYELFLCKFCDCLVRKGEELQHISSDANHLVTKRFPTLTGFIEYTTASSHESLQLDNIQDYSSSHTSLEALNSPRHTKNEIESKIDVKNTFSDLKPRLLSESDINDSEKSPLYFCTFCKVDIENNDFNIKQHVAGNTHMQNAKLLDIEEKSKEREYASSVHNIPSDLDNRTSHEVGNKHVLKYTSGDRWIEVKSQPHTRTISDNNFFSHNAKSFQQNMDQYFCRICRVQVPNNPHNIESHDNGKLHNKNFKLLNEEKSNKLKKWK